MANKTGRRTGGGGEEVEPRGRGPKPRGQSSGRRSKDPAGGGGRVQRGRPRWGLGLGRGNHQNALHVDENAQPLRAASADGAGGGPTRSAVACAQSASTSEHPSCPWKGIGGGK